MTHDDEPPYDPTYDHGSVTPIRTPHRNLEAERALLGAILLDPNQAMTTTGLLDENDFDNPAHGTLWHAITTITTRDATPPDYLAIRRELEHTGQFTRTAQLLADLPAACPSPLHAHTYAQDVARAARARRITHQLRHSLHAVETATPATLDLAAAEALERITEATTSFGPTHTTSPLHTDLTGLLANGIPEADPPTICRRQDGHALFYPGRVNGLYGDPESAKTWIAQQGVVETISTGGRATIIDVDHNGAAVTTARLLGLGAHPEHIADPDLFRYYQPDDRDELLATITQATTWAPHIAVLDSLGELLPMYGASSVDNDEITAALRHLATPLASAGAAVITIDHLPKNADARTSGYAIGGTAKKRAMDGALIHVDTKTPAAPGKTGRMVLRIEKDRPGRLREVSPGKYAGTFVLDSTHPDQIIATIDLETIPTSDDGARRYTIFMEKISRYVEDNDQASFNEIRKTVGGNEKQIKAAITTLIDEGFLTTLPGPRNSTLHHSIAHYREADDDRA